MRDPDLQECSIYQHGLLGTTLPNEHILAYLQTWHTGSGLLLLLLLLLLHPAKLIAATI